MVEETRYDSVSRYHQMLPLAATRRTWWFLLRVVMWPDTKWTEKLWSYSTHGAKVNCWQSDRQLLPLAVYEPCLHAAITIQFTSSVFAADYDPTIGEPHKACNLLKLCVCVVYSCDWVQYIWLYSACIDVCKWLAVNNQCSCMDAMVSKFVCSGCSSEVGGM